MDAVEWPDRPATGIAAAIKARQVAPIEVIDTALTRIEHRASKRPPLREYL